MSKVTLTSKGPLTLPIPKDVRERLGLKLETAGHRLRVEGGQVTVAALEAMAREGVDFADALLAESARAGGRPRSRRVRGPSTGRGP